MSTTLDERHVLAHAAFLRRLVRGVVGDEEAVDDVLQETFLAGLAVPAPPPGSSFNLAGWLVRVAQRVAGRTRRATERRMRREQAAAQPERLGATVDAVSREEVLRAVTDAVLALDEPYRQAVLLRYYEALTPEEIAERCAVPLATVKSRLQRARDRLRVRLRSQVDEDLRGALGWIGGIPGAAGPSAVGTVPLAAAATTSSATLATFLGACTVSASMKAGLVAGAVVLAGAAWWVAAGDGSRRDVEQLPVPRAPLETATGVANTASEVAPAAQRTVEPASDSVTTDTQPDLPLDPRFASIIVHVVWAKDGTPAPGRSISLFQWKAPPALRIVKRKSDASGSVRIDGLQSGKIYVEADLGGEVSIDGKAGTLTEATLSIEAGYSVRGRVVDSQHQPVAGAAIWCSSYFNYESGTIVATSDAAGSFEIPSVPEARYLAATKGGFGPSLLTYVEELHQKVASERERAAAMATPKTTEAGRPSATDDVNGLDLVLLGEGCGLRGRVLDPAGKPAVGAMVHVVGQLPPTPERAPSDGPAMIAPYDADCDAVGGFDLQGLPPGRATIRVLHAGCAPQEQSCTLTANETAEVFVQLSGEGIVQGRVITSAGAPVAEAEVRPDAEYDPLHPFAKTDENGRFSLAGLRVGSVGIVARHEKLGKGRASVHLVPGVVTPCELVLDPGLVLQGVLVDEAGAPVPGMGVEVHDDTHQFWGQAKTQADGTFRILNCPDDPLMLAVKMEFTDWDPLLARPGVRAGGEELRLVLSTNATARIHATVVAPDGGPALASLTPWLLGQSMAHNHETDPQTGVVDVVGLAPGRYSLSLGGKDLPTRHLGTYTLAGGERLDLGTIVLEACGRVKVRTGGEPGRGRFEIVGVRALGKSDPPAGAMVAFLSAPESLAGIELAPGRYLLCASASDVATCSRQFEVLSGQEVTVDLEEIAGVSCSVEIELSDEMVQLAAEAPLDGWIEGDGFMAPLPLPFWRANPEARSLMTLRLAPGSYRLFVELAGKPPVRADLEVAEGSTPRTRIVVR